MRQFLIASLLIFTLGRANGSDQQIWFAPLPNIQLPGTPHTGSLDYMSLFTAGAPWANAAARVSVFKFYGGWLSIASDADLSTAIQGLNQRHIAIAMETGLVNPDGTCGSGVEGFVPVDVNVQWAQRIKAAGGVLSYIAMDEPFQHASLYDGPGACGWTAQKIAQNVAASIKAIQAVFPDVLVGDIEVVPVAGGNGNAPDWANQYAAWFDAFRVATGVPLVFFDADVDWVELNWRESIGEARQAAAQRGIPFGIIYNGWGPTDLTDADWVNDAENHFVDYEIHGGMPPDLVIFQSWDAYPQHTLPETDPTTFTHLIDSYFRARTQLTINGGSQQISGRLSDSSGAPLPSSTIQVTGVPIAGNGTIGTYTITGTVPVGISTALVGIRVNEECNCQGSNNTTLYSFQYTEYNQSAPSATLDFSNGLNGWGLGPGTGTIEPGPLPFSQGLHVTAQPTQAVQLNSATFATTPGASFSLQITARISPDSVGSGYFMIVFLTNGSGESSRDTLAFQPATVSLGSASTIADGSFSLNLPVSSLGAPVEDPSAYLIEAQYGGNDTYWPAYAGFSVTINPAGCSYALNLGGQAFGSAGGSGVVNITTAQGCSWQISDIPSWLTITSPMSGTGSGSVSYQVGIDASADLSSPLNIAGLTFTLEQEIAAIPDLNLVGSMPHIAGEENWTTAFTLVNKSADLAEARLSLFGDPTGSLVLPLAFPQQPDSSGPLLAASFDRALAANASLIVDSAGAQTPPVLVGSAQLAATGAVDGFAIFHQIVTTQEAVVPMETRNASSYLLAFDNTNELVLGVSVENVSAQNAVIPVIIRDDTGAVINSPGAIISLGANGHTSFVLSDPTLGFPVTANKRGTIEFDTPAGGQISVLGLRFTPPNNALTTIPALANVGTGGGSIAHLASGGDGWQTTFVLVNTGSSSTSATLSFFNDQTGSPVALPLEFPQTGGGTTMTVPTYTAQMAAGATLLIVSTGVQTLITGSAQLATTGHVSGFVIFRHNGQEAVVPLESRNANGYIIAFDNTNGTATGIAVNAVSSQQVNVPVIVRDDTGAQIATDTIALAANGHYAFTLGTDRYPAALTIRGTIEFDKPADARIGALGIRIPSVAAHTYTTLPALAR